MLLRDAFVNSAGFEISTIYEHHRLSTVNNGPNLRTQSSVVSDAIERTRTGSCKCRTNRRADWRESGKSEGGRTTRAVFYALDCHIRLSCERGGVPRGCTTTGVRRAELDLEIGED